MSEPYVDVGPDSRWPSIGQRLSDLEWTLRYGVPTRSDLLHAASILNAYRALVLQKAGDRAVIIQELRSAAEAEPKAED